jgi:hypothetical protein
MRLLWWQRNRSLLHPPRPPTYYVSGQTVYYYCSFCRKDTSDGRRMVAGHDGFICYPCIDLVSEVKREDEDATKV